MTRKKSESNHDDKIPDLPKEVVEKYLTPIEREIYYLLKGLDRKNEKSKNL